MTQRAAGSNAVELTGELSARGEPYVLATVVWRRSPSSGQVGSKAVITADGRSRGWLGGACAEPAVVAEARRALAEGTPRLMLLGTPDELAGEHRAGVVTVPIACQSEGALEVYVEPVVPAPHLVVIGRSPAAEALAGMGEALGWRTQLVAAEETMGSDFDAAGVADRSFVVIATQGHFDEAALERALGSDAAYVGLVASARRAESVKGYLRDRGVDQAQLDRIHAPAGLDLGHVRPEEIAVAILAELVQLKAKGLAGGVKGAAISAGHEAVDPVCGMTVRVSDAGHRVVHDGVTYYFCSAGCRAAFEKDPASFLSVPGG
ncbi:MAG: YHS domain-containing protein [Actinobacteria bacterium]|nr:MAG: YHS domain-containing protein [Actinomycetota bacterium]